MESSLKSIKGFVKSRLPWLYRAWRAWHQWRADRFNSRYRELVERITKEHGWIVRSGVFRGMRYVDQARSSALLPKLLGSYEREIADEIERAAGVDYRVCVDIGSAEGYYAIG